MAKPRVFFDITAGGSPAGRIVIEVHTIFLQFWFCYYRYGFRYCHAVLMHANASTVNTFFLLQLRADVVPKTAGKP